MWKNKIQRLCLVQCLPESAGSLKDELGGSCGPSHSPERGLDLDPIESCSDGTMVTYFIAGQFSRRIQLMCSPSSPQTACGGRWGSRNWSGTGKGGGGLLESQGELLWSESGQGGQSWEERWEKWRGMGGD